MQNNKQKGRMYKILRNSSFYCTLWAWSKRDAHKFLLGKYNNEKGRKRSYCTPLDGRLQIIELI